MSPALEGRGRRKRGGQDWGLGILSLSAALQPLAGAKDMDTQRKVMNVPPAVALYHAKGLCPPGQHPSLAAQGSPVAPEGVSARAGGALGFPKMQHRHDDRHSHCYNPGIGSFQ